MIANYQNTRKNDDGAHLALELDRLHHQQERLQRLYPYLETAPELRGLFMAELAALNVRADRLDAFLEPSPGFAA